MRETVTVRIRLDEPSLIPVLLTSLFHLCCLMIMLISLKFCISLWGAVGWSIACHLFSCDWMFGSNTFLSNHCDFCHLRTSKLLFLCLRTSKTVNLGEFVSRYLWLTFVLNSYMKLASFPQFTVLFVGIVHVFMFSLILYSRYSHFVN